MTFVVECTRKHITAGPTEQSTQYMHVNCLVTLEGQAPLHPCMCDGHMVCIVILQS